MGSARDRQLICEKAARLVVQPPLLGGLSPWRRSCGAKRPAIHLPRATGVNTMFNYGEHWRRMLLRSFSPRQWCEDGDRPSIDETCFTETLMWVYRNEGGIWVVGFYTPDGEWNQDAPFGSREKAAERVHYLNGGGQRERAQEPVLTGAALESRIAGGSLLDYDDDRR